MESTRLIIVDSNNDNNKPQYNDRTSSGSDGNSKPQ